MPQRAGEFTFYTNGIVPPVGTLVDGLKPACVYVHITSCDFPIPKTHYVRHATCQSAPQPNGRGPGRGPPGSIYYNIEQYMTHGYYNILI